MLWSGGRRMMQSRPSASVRRTVMLERPPTICSAVNGGWNCGTFVVNHRASPSRSMPAGACAATPLLPGEVRCSPLGHRGDSLAEVVGAAQGLLRFVLALRGVLHLAREVAAHGLADGQQCERARRRDLGRQLPRRVAEVVGAGEAVAETDRERFGAPRLTAGVQQLERALLADDGGERHGDAESLVEAELGV